MNVFVAIKILVISFETRDEIIRVVILTCGHGKRPSDFHLLHLGSSALTAE